MELLYEERPWESPYAYTDNNTLNRIDPDGKFWDTILDVVAIGYDIYDIAKTVASGEQVSSIQVAALGADVLSAAVPFVAGGGAAVRAASKVDDAVDAVKAADKISDFQKNVKRGREAEKRVLKDLGLEKNTKKVIG